MKMRCPTVWEKVTLLLVIAILTGLAWPTMAINRVAPSRTVVMVLFSQLQVACQAYQEEYGILPKVSGNVGMTDVLNGNNPKKIVFIEFHSKSLNQNKEVIDPWGTPLRFGFLPDSDILIESAGKDRIFETKDDLSNKK